MPELWIAGVFAAALLLCVGTGHSILYALLLGYFLFFGYGLRKRHSAAQMLRFSLRGVRAVKNILLIFVLIGVITAVWRAGGTIAYIVYHATRLCAPAVMLPASFLLCCLVSVLTGTSFGTAATVGVICMTMANGMGIPPLYSGGAILSGCFFGDRCSPMSTSALLICELTGTDIYRNIARMVKTSAVPFALACAVYLAVGLLFEPGGDAAGAQAILSAHFALHPATLLPAAVIILLSLLRVPVKRTMGASIVAGAAAAVLIQRVAPGELLGIAVLGYRPADAALAALLSGGGVLSMAKVFAIILISSCYAGMFKGTGFLDGMQGRLLALSRRVTPFGGVLLTSIVTAVISCNQTLGIMLTHQLCQEAEPEPELLASHLENTVVVIAPLIPWSIASAAPLESIGAPSASVLAACYLYLLPLWNLLAALRQRKRDLSAAQPDAPSDP